MACTRLYLDWYTPGFKIDVGSTAMTVGRRGDLAKVRRVVSILAKMTVIADRWTPFDHEFDAPRALIRGLVR
jgi:hypothetical protein